MSIDNQVLAMFNALAPTYAAAAANTGEGLQGEWPPEGISDHLLKGVTSKVDKGKNKDGSEYPQIVVQFEYEELVDTKSDPTRDPSKPPLVWKGEIFRLIPNYDKVLNEAGHKTAARIAEERFKGHCSKILRKSKEECVNPGADLVAIDTLLSNSNPALQMKIQYRSAPVKGNTTGKIATYKTEFVMDNISG